MLLRLFVGVALLCASTIARADNGLSTVKLEEALTSAKTAKKAVLIEFSTKWCAACREFERHVLKNWKVQRGLGDIVFLRYDAEDSPGIDAAGAYRVSTYPTFLAVDGSGLERFRRTGGEVNDEDAFLDLIADTKALYEDEAQMRERLKSNPSDVRAKLEAARWYAARKQTREALKELDAVSKLKGRSADKTEAARFADRLRRISVWKGELVKSSVRSIRGDYAKASVDDLIIATIGSGLPEREAQGLFKEVFKAHADSDDLVPYLYVALAAGLSRDAAAVAENLAKNSTNARRFALLAECRHATGDHEGALSALDTAIVQAKGTPFEAELKLDRERIERKLGDSVEVQKARLKASDLWQRVETLDQLRPMSAANPAGGGLYPVVKAVQKAAGPIATKCKSDAGSADRVYGLLDIDNTTGQVVSETLYMQDSTNQNLRDCLEKELHALQLPTCATRVPRQSITFVFR